MNLFVTYMHVNDKPQSQLYGIWDWDPVNFSNFSQLRAGHKIKLPEVVSAGSSTDKVNVWHVMDSLPMAHDADQTLPMTTDEEIPSSVGILLMKEDMEVAQHMERLKHDSMTLDPENEIRSKAWFLKTAMVHACIYLMMHLWNCLKIIK